MFNAAMQARRIPLWEPYYLALRGREFSTTAAFVALGRKLAQVAFARLQKNVEFDPKTLYGGLTGNIEYIAHLIPGLPLT